MMASPASECRPAKPARALKSGFLEAPQGIMQGMNAPRHAGLIIREKDPENLEYPFSTLDSVLTSNDRFFVRSHFPALPPLEARSWRLRVEGGVERPFEIGYEALRRLPARTLAATIECAGNGRIFLSPKAKGLQWEMGAVGT